MKYVKTLSSVAKWWLKTLRSFQVENATLFKLTIIFFYEELTSYVFIKILELTYFDAIY